VENKTSVITETNSLVELCLDNGYSLDFFDRVNSRIKTLINSKRNSTSKISSNKENNYADNSFIFKKFIIFPYITKISELASSTIDKIKYITEYRVLNSLEKFIKVHKDTNQFLSNNNVVYKISCKDCDASYVGKTKKTTKNKSSRIHNNTH